MVGVPLEETEAKVEVLVLRVVPVAVAWVPLEEEEEPFVGWAKAREPEEALVREEALAWASSVLKERYTFSSFASK